MRGVTADTMDPIRHSDTTLPTGLIGGGPVGGFFARAFDDLGVDMSRLVSWPARAAGIDAQALPTAEGMALLAQAWQHDRHMGRLTYGQIARLEPFFSFASVAARQQVIRQDEYGNFMVMLVDGTIAVDRRQPWGEELRLAEVRPGDVLGEMSLLDSGIRFSTCTTLDDCAIAVLTAEALDRMVDAEPQLAANLIALLARKLSLRLRVVSARLGDGS